MNIIIGEKAGFCAGVQNAVNNTKKVLLESKQEKIIYCLGDLVHNPVVMNQLSKLGLEVIKDLSEIADPIGKKVIIRAHGVKKEIYEQAKELGIELVDLTCPNVLVIHKLVEQYINDGYYTLIIGQKEHPEVIGTASFCENNYQIIETEEELKKSIEYIKLNNLKKIFIVSQTTFSLEKFQNYVNKIQEEVEAEVVVKNTICNATKVRQDETINLANEVDYMIIIGGKTSSNTNKLYDISCKNCKNVIMIENVQDLNSSEVERIKSFDKVGIMAGASTPQESIDEVKNKLEN